MEIEQKPEGVEMSTLNEQSKQQEFVPPVENGVFQGEKPKEKFNGWRVLNVLIFIPVGFFMVTGIPMFLYMTWALFTVILEAGPIEFFRESFMENGSLGSFVVLWILYISYVFILFYSFKASKNGNYKKAVLLNIAPISAIIVLSIAVNLFSVLFGS